MTIMVNFNSCLPLLFEARTQSSLEKNANFCQRTLFHLNKVFFIKPDNLVFIEDLDNEFKDISEIAKKFKNCTCTNGCQVKLISKTINFNTHGKNFSFETTSLENEIQQFLDNFIDGTQINAFKWSELEDVVNWRNTKKYYK